MPKGTSKAIKQELSQALEIPQTEEEIREREKIEAELRLLELKKKELALLKERKKYEDNLPHLYRKHYTWSRAYYESDNRINLICAANQIGKSSVAIRRAIANATEPKRWKKLWGLKQPPGMFWYFYPDTQTVAREFSTKWLDWLPKNEMQNDPVYGWKPMPKTGSRTIPGIEFNSGVKLYFMTYSQDASSIQASTVWEITADEELPLNLYDELILRLTRTKGIFNAVFTPTLNQAFWREVFETQRRLPMSFKQQVSMYDCVKYEDGTPSEFFNEETIKDIESKCKSELEVQRRVFGRFVTEEGRIFSGFSPSRNLVPRKPVTNLQVYSAVDPGSGGAKGHPAAIVFVALEPDCRKGYVFKAWRGDGIETSTQDILNKYIELKGKHHITLSSYDFSARDFGIIAERAGLGFIKANKARNLGEDLLNTLFKAGMLEIFDDGVDSELYKLVIELNHAMTKADGKKLVGSIKRDDDLLDALRYCVMSMPWDLTDLTIDDEAQAEKKQEEKRVFTAKELELLEIEAQIRARRGEDSRGTGQMTGWDEEYNDEIEELNDFYG